MDTVILTNEVMNNTSISPLKTTTSPKSRNWSPRSSPKSLKAKAKDDLSKEGLPKSNRHSYSRRYWRPKKGGANGNGAWGGIVDTNTSYSLNHSDPNHNGFEDVEFLSPRRICEAFKEYKKKATIIIEEYFANDDIISTANELSDIGMPNYDYYFVKKMVSMAMDKHDKEREMAAVLLSSLYADVINPAQVYKGFSKLIECVDDLVVDIPDAVDILSIFIARAIVDDILPPIFLKNHREETPKDSKGVEVLIRTEKCYLSTPYHAEAIENKWGGNKNKSVEDVKEKIGDLLKEYVVSGDKKEACRCIRELNVPFFHHEIIKRALVMTMERRQAEGKILNLLKMAAEENLINSSQISKGFNRLIDATEDLSLDIPDARQILKSLISKCASEGWLSASSLKSFSLALEKRSVKDDITKNFKITVQAMIQEFFLSGDTIEVYNCLAFENYSSSSELNAIFVKRLLNTAMDRRNREKEMASVLLSSLCLPPDDVANGFISLMESADDIALDNPIIIEDLAKFFSRAIVDEVITPSHLDYIGASFMSSGSIGSKIIQLTRTLINARLSGERILRCWGGEGSKAGWAVEDVKDKIGKLLEEYECGGDLGEACRCIKELNMHFYHHEVVKKALIIIMEKRNERLWRLLEECFNSGLISMYQMTKGFGRAKECLDDLTLDVPDVKLQFSRCFEKADGLGWLDPSCSSFESLHIANDS